MFLTATCLNTPAACFRRVIPAASLKLAAAGDATHTGIAFPPGNSGGLIEAGRSAGSRARGPWWFPPGNSGGLIEARTSRQRSPAPHRQFPPGNSGGLIEAMRPNKERWGTGSFRRVIPAASLKRLRRATGCRATPRGFRRVIPAASLKHRGMVTRTVMANRFRRVIPAASLKLWPEHRWIDAASSAFPPGNSGGLIEACRSR